VKLQIRHNLTEQELKKAIVSLAAGGGGEEQVIKALQRSVCSCEGPKEPRDPATRELFHRFRGEYQRARKDILRIIARLIASVSPKGLHKALPSTPLTKAQIRAIQQAIRDRFELIAAQLQDDYEPDPDLLLRWQENEWVAPNVTPEDFALTVRPEDRYIRNAFVFGRLHQAVEGGGSYADIMRRAMTLPLTKPDLQAIAVAEQQTANYITALGDDVAKAAGEIIAAQHRQTIRDMAVDFHARKLRARVLDEDAKRELGLDIPERTVDTWQGFKSELHQVMEDKSRDWDRVAYYEIHDAKGQGQALGIIEELGPKKLVYKMPLPTACPQCKHLYLEDDGTPRLFQIDQLAGWGNNVGRKPHPIKGGQVVPGGRPDGAETLMPVTGQTHPFCQCLGVYPFTGHEPWASAKRNNAKV